MHFPALALAQRAPRLDARGHASYALRALLVLFVLLALWNVSQLSRFWGAPGLHLLRWMIVASFFFIALIAAAGFVVGAALAPETFGFLYRRVLQGAWWYMLGLAVVTLHLTAWLSLRLQRGAFATAILLVFVGHTMVGMMLVYVHDQASMATFGVCLLLIALLMHPAIGRVLRRKAAE